MTRFQTSEERWTAAAAARTAASTGEYAEAPSALLAGVVATYQQLDRALARAGMVSPRQDDDAVLLDLAASLIAFIERAEGEHSAQSAIVKEIARLSIVAVDTGQVGRCEPVENTQAAWQFLGMTSVGMIETGSRAAGGDQSMSEEVRLQALEAAAAAIMMLTLTESETHPTVG